MKKTLIMITVALITAVVTMSSGVSAHNRTTGRGTGPVVYVESQGLFYDSIVLATLPALGNFQLLRPGEGSSGELATDFGPGDVGYLGGRWWVDANPNGFMDEDDVYFLCPLLGPGRTEL